ncbi:MAG: BamA/TamA family outer membrane protein [Candidatus Krumholzibacteriota bacterium]|nr:BamA/TamA family outer membrane protein [Candidatus Krumholzibacteriota bacterium]
MFRVFLAAVAGCGWLIFFTPAPSFSYAGEKEDTLSGKGGKSYIMPILFYTPETKLAGGAAAARLFRARGERENSRPSTVSPVFIYTEKKQIIASLGGEFYRKGDSICLQAGLGYLEFPDVFYGIGRDTPAASKEDYTPRSAELSANIKKKIWRDLYAGIAYRYIRKKIIKTERGGLLAAKRITGSDQGTVSGAGILVNWDTRDNLFYPRQGGYYMLTAYYYPGLTGSDFDFNTYNLDLRRYYSFTPSHTMAFRYYMKMVTGNAPFYMLSWIGGQSLMRGYYEGRYRDRHALVFQAEYRVKIWWRVGMAGFASLGDVADELRNFHRRSFRTTYGAGLRGLINTKEELSIRMDFGFGNGVSGLYISFNEAF